MMRNPEQTIGNLIDKQTVSLVGSIADDGFPNVKAMGAPRKQEGIPRHPGQRRLSGACFCLPQG